MSAVAEAEAVIEAWVESGDNVDLLEYLRSLAERLDAAEATR